MTTCKRRALKLRTVEMCFSVQDGGAQPPVRPVNIGKPRDMILNVPRPRLDERGVPLRIEDYELDKQTIEHSLELMAQYLRQKNEDITVIAIGGTVNTVLLRSRKTTHDIDFLGTNIDNRLRGLLDEAAQYAEIQSPVPLGGEWFNNQAMLWLSPKVHRVITEAALQQNDVIFNQPGLKLVAAPWTYAFLAKVDRLSKDTARSYDLEDAVVYLRHYIDRHNGQPISIPAIRQWAKDFHTQVSMKVLRRVASMYQRRYRSVGIARR